MGLATGRQTTRTADRRATVTWIRLRESRFHSRDTGGPSPKRLPFPMLGGVLRIVGRRVRLVDDVRVHAIVRDLPDHQKPRQVWTSSGAGVVEDVEFMPVADRAVLLVPLQHGHYPADFRSPSPHLRC